MVSGCSSPSVLLSLASNTANKECRTMWLFTAEIPISFNFVDSKINVINICSCEFNSHNTLPSFKLKFSLGFITSCYVIFGLSMVQAMDIFMIT